MKKPLIAAMLLALLGLSNGVVRAASGNATVDFSHGMQGWNGDRSGSFGAIDSALGNGTPAFHVDSIGYGFQIKTFVNPDFIGDYTAYPSLTLSIDVTVDKLAIGNSNGEPMTEKFYVELRDYDKPSINYNYSSVWYELGSIAAGTGTQHLETTIADTSANLVPAGWHALGDYDEYGNDTLPYGQTFRRLLSDVDQVVFGTIMPNGDTNAPNYYHLSVDNIAIQAAAVPEPEPLAMLGLGLGLIGFVARRRQRAAQEARP